MPQRCSLPWLCVLWITLGSSAVLQAKPSDNRLTPLVRAIQRVRPSVVNIHSEKTVPVRGNALPDGSSPRNRMSGMGTGVVVDKRGYIVTNYHVIEDVSSIRVTLVDGTTHSAQVIARDREIDLALLRIEAPAALSEMPMGTSADLMRGETVIAIGNAYGYEHTITRGIVSELHRDVRLSEKQSYRDLIQTDASINPGNSGGPLINADGEMIGLNVAIRAGAQGIGFAIPVDDLKRVLTKLLSVRSLQHTWHGIVSEPAPTEDGSSQGIFVRRVESGSPAESAGLQAGDILVAIGELPLHAPYDVERALLGKNQREKVAMELTRDGEKKTLSLVLDTADAPQHDPKDIVWQRLGLRLAEGIDISEIRRVSAQLRGGLRVVEVAVDGSASRAGLRNGDVLVGLHHFETLNVENVVYVLNKPLSTNPLRFYVIRGNQIHRGWLTIPEMPKAELAGK